MSLILFHQTLLVLLVSILVAATSFSAYLVSHRKVLLYAAAGFLFYFFDVAYVFQDEYSVLLGETIGSWYLFGRSLVLLVTGAGFLTCLWLALCAKLDVTNNRLRWAPTGVFIVGSLIVLLVPTSGLQRFAFYGMRELYGLWMLGFIIFSYITSKSGIVRTFISQRWAFFGLLFLLLAAVVAEDWVFLVVIDLPFVQIGPLTISTERNYAEEVLMVVMAVVTFRAAARTLNLRFEKPPQRECLVRNENLDDVLRLYAHKHGLSERESEVLLLVIDGKDNQNIASELSLALSTVKVHVHNILQKTSCANRQELTRDVWKLM